MGIKESTINLFTLIAVITFISFSASSCTKNVQQGAGVGAAVGAAAGALIDDDNRWRGAVIGGALGAALGGTLADISDRASREAAQEGRPVAYESEDGYRRVEASPQGFDEKTKCHKLRERVWEDGRLVKDEIREICESEKVESEY